MMRHNASINSRANEIAEPSVYQSKKPTKKLVFILSFSEKNKSSPKNSIQHVFPTKPAYQRAK
jgi:hypothetical protein